jgi:cytochrome c-type biogenesis protein CcmE
MSAAMKAMIIPFPQLHRLGAGVIAGGTMESGSFW